jgi:hypothetical protein
MCCCLGSDRSLTLPLPCRTCFQTWVVSVGHRNKDVVVDRLEVVGVGEETVVVVDDAGGQGGDRGSVACG